MTDHAVTKTQSMEHKQKQALSAGSRSLAGFRCSESLKQVGYLSGQNGDPRFWGIMLLMRLRHRGHVRARDARLAVGKSRTSSGLNEVAGKPPDHGFCSSSAEVAGGCVPCLPALQKTLQLDTMTLRGGFSWRLPLPALLPESATACSLPPFSVRGASSNSLCKAS